MHPLIARATATTWIRGARDPGFGLDARPGGRGDPRAPAGPGLPHLAEQPDRRARCRSPWWRRSARPPPAWSWSTRPTPSSPGTPLARRSRCCRAFRAWSSPAPCPRRSRWPAPGSGTWPPSPEVVEALLLVRLPYHLSAAHPGGGQGRAGAPAGAAGHRGPRCGPSATSWCSWLREPRARRRGLRRELRPVRGVRRLPRRLAGAAGPRRAGPRDRPARLAAGQHRPARRDGGVPRGPGRGPRQPGASG